MNIFSTNMRYALLSAGILLLDRVSKYVAVTWLAHTVKVTSFLDLTLAVNRGISWGFLSTTNIVYSILVRLCIIGLIGLLGAHMTARYRQHRSIYAEVAIFTGALCNLLDRFVYGGVIDFIHLYYGAWSWPIFNIADVAIVGGVLWMIAYADTYDV